MEKMKYLKTCAVFFAALIPVIIVSTNSYGGKKMEFLYDLNAVGIIAPQEFNMKEHYPIHLFAVPRDNAIGTSYFNNAITLLQFEKGRLIYNELFKASGLSLYGGDMRHVPNFDPDVIGYSQTRRFLLIDLKKKNYIRHGISTSFGDSITKVAVANGVLKQFLFNIQEFPQNSNGSGMDFTEYIYLMDLSGTGPDLIKKLHIGTGVSWSVQLGKLFMHNLNTKKVLVLTTNLEPAYHPLGDVLNRNMKKLSFVRITTHPTLPFAILWFGKYGPDIVFWDGRKKEGPCKLVYRGDWFTFSTDGKWVVFQIQSSGIGATYLMPVSKQYPNYLGTPVMLIYDYFNENNYGWTSNPVSFVGSGLDKLYRWELTKEAQRAMMGKDFDKYPTFHDYIVAKDLEKLTKEKKQGLGN